MSLLTKDIRDLRQPWVTDGCLKSLLYWYFLLFLCFSFEYLDNLPMQYHVGNECQDADDWNFFGVFFKITDFLPCLISKYHYQFTYHHSYIFQFNDVKTSTAKFLWAAQTKKRTACKLMELYASLCNRMQAHVSACILEHSGTYSMNYGTFWNFLHAFWNILELSACILEHSRSFCMHYGTCCICIL